MLCKAVVVGYNWGMKPVFHALSLLAIACALNACRTTPPAGVQAPNVGPFDKNGNYVDAWADDPSKWRPYTPKGTDGDLPKIAKGEQPLDSSVPLAAGSPATGRPSAVTSGRPAADSGRLVAKTNGSKTKGDSGHAVAKTSSSKTTGSKSKGDSEHAVAKTTGTKGKGDSEHAVAKTTGTKSAGSKTSSAKTKPKADPDSEPAAKSSSKTKSGATKPKAKSSTTHHTVKPGDSLNSIASKYGTTVSALKAANGISGTTIRDGRSLVIPARK